MKAIRKTKGTAVSVPVGVTIGVLTCLAITLILVAVLTWLVLTGRLVAMSIGYFVMGTLLLASLLGGLVSALKIKRRWLLMCCITGGLYYLMLLIVTALFFGGIYRGVGVSGIMIVVGSLIAGMLGIRTNRALDKSYKKYHSC